MVEEVIYKIQLKWAHGWTTLDSCDSLVTANKFYENEVKQNPQKEYRLIKITAEVIRKV